MPHIQLTILLFVRWSATSFFFLMGQVLLPYNILLRTCLGSTSTGSRRGQTPLKLENIYQTNTKFKYLQT